MDLDALGYSAAWQAELDVLKEDDPKLVAARVAEEQRGLCLVFGDFGELRADVAGRILYEGGPEARPVVGDWVAIRPRLDEGRATVRHVLRRTSALVRKAPDDRSVPSQVLAANLDAVYVVSSLNRDFNARRIERTLALVWESGAVPVLVLTKADLCDDPEPLRAEAERVALGVAIHTVSSVSGAGMDVLAAGLVPGSTAALIGSSGVGKSTLINQLAGRELLATAAVREDDDRGRHTTSHRQLVALPGGALFIDTPGIREVGLWDAEEGVATAFADLEAFAADCRFDDCAHAGEPGCGVEAAVADGRLGADRVASWQKLERELARLEIQRDRRAQAEERKGRRRFSKMVRRRMKDKRDDRS